MVVCHISKCLLVSQNTIVNNCWPEQLKRVHNIGVLRSNGKKPEHVHVTRCFQAALNFTTMTRLSLTCDVLAVSK